MLVHATTAKQKIVFLSGELKLNVDHAFPIDRTARIVGGGLKASGLNRTDGRITEPMAQVADHSQDLNGARRSDSNLDRDVAFNMKLFGLGGVLWLGFEENLGSALCRGRGWACRLWHGWRSVLSEVNFTHSIVR